MNRDKLKIKTFNVKKDILLVLSDLNRLWKKIK